MSRFKAVLFDIGGTLIQPVNVPEVFRNVLKDYSVERSLDEIAAAHQQNKRFFFDTDAMVKLGREFWVEWNARILERLGIQENREFLAKEIDESWWDYADLKLYTDVKGTLKELKGLGVKTGIITNGFEADFRQVLLRTGLENVFDVKVGVDTCRKAKPDKMMFLYAVNKLGVQPNEAIFVGDSIERDYNGAKKASLKALLIDRTGKAPANVEKIRSLREVLTYISHV